MYNLKIPKQKESKYKKREPIVYRIYINGRANQVFWGKLIHRFLKKLNLLFVLINPMTIQPLGKKIPF